MSGDRVDPLNRPVTVRRLIEQGAPCPPQEADVIPHEFLAALDDDARAAAVRHLLAPVLGDTRTMNRIAQGWDAPMMFTNGSRSYDAQRLGRMIGAVVAALCEGARDE